MKENFVLERNILFARSFIYTIVDTIILYQNAYMLFIILHLWCLMANFNKFYRDSSWSHNPCKTSIGKNCAR